MFDRPPKEREALSWAYVLFWSCLTFATVPFVRYSVTFVREELGGAAFTYGVSASIVLATTAALYLTRQRWSLASCIWLLGLAGLLIYLTFGLADGNAEEAVHYVQYGILSILLFRAFSHRIRDFSIYAAATIAGTLVGMIDETVQWLTPGRFFDLRDIWLNCTAVALVQVGLAAGVRPALISGLPGWDSVRRLCYLGAVTLGYLGLCLQNTPDRIAWYSTHVPGLGFIDPDQSVMVEYGYLHGDPATVHFRSRLTADELRRSSRERAEDGSRILDQYRTRDEYPTFLEIYSPLADPFLHEARVHLFRRDMHLGWAMDGEEGDAQGQHFATAYWENRILQDYFGEVLRASSYEWTPEQAAAARDGADIADPHDSWVSRHLIVALSPLQLAVLSAGIVAALLLLGVYSGRRASRQPGARTRAFGDGAR
ncbi:MAG: VanZ family protein [Roseovarius sp.]